MGPAVTGPRARGTGTCTAATGPLEAPSSCLTPSCPDTPVFSPPPPTHRHAPCTQHRHGGKRLTRSVLAVGEGVAGGESDVDFLLRGNSLLRVYREDMAALSSRAKRGRGHPGVQPTALGRQLSRREACPSPTSSRALWTAVPPGVLGASLRCLDRVPGSPKAHSSRGRRPDDRRCNPEAGRPWACGAAGAARSLPAGRNEPSANMRLQPGSTR